MFQAVELGNKVDKASYKEAVPQLRVDLLNLQFDLETAQLSLINGVVNDASLLFSRGLFRFFRRCRFGRGVTLGFLGFCAFSHMTYLSTGVPTDGESLYSIEATQV